MSPFPDYPNPPMSETPGAAAPLLGPGCGKEVKIQRLLKSPWLDPKMNRTWVTEAWQACRSRFVFSAHSGDYSATTSPSGDPTKGGSQC